MKEVSIEPTGLASHPYKVVVKQGDSKREEHCFCRSLELAHKCRDLAMSET